MISKQVFIIGTPRSGTSMLQKIIRDHPLFWSLPSESEIIWHLHCHPKLNNWDSEAFGAEDATPEAIEEIRSGLEKHSGPAWLWKNTEKTGYIWSFKKSRSSRYILRTLYQTIYPKVRKMVYRQKKIYFIDKTSGNCLRLGYVDRVFPEAKFLYLIRNPLSNINSLINAWQNPNRFFTYDVPLKLNIKGYNFDKWNFLLPPDWRDYVNSPLEEVCAFIWLACHKAILKEIDKPIYEGRVLRVKLEEITRDPKIILEKITEFIDVPWDDYFDKLSHDLPIINSPDNDPNQEKWKTQNSEMIKRIIPMVEPMMKQLGYTI
jgi:hypothetical protein